jgi:hypothetical protein
MFTEAMIRERSLCVHMLVVCSPVPSRKNPSVAYWVRSWADVYTDRNVLEIFWDAKGSLAGISLSHDSQRRLFGRDDTSEGYSKHTVVLEKGDWITGLILHLPVLSLHITTRHPDSGTINGFKTTSVKGVTVSFRLRVQRKVSARLTKNSRSLEDLA